MIAEEMEFCRSLGGREHDLAGSEEEAVGYGSGYAHFIHRLGLHERPVRVNPGYIWVSLYECLSVLFLYFWYKLKNQLQERRKY
jgi:hypothetical protein